MAYYAITGATTGIGAATKDMLEKQGHAVINIDIVNGDITADLADKAERKRAMEELAKRAPEGLDGFVACAEVGPSETPDRIVNLNYFAAKECTEAAYELLMKKKGVALIVSSDSATMTGLNTAIVDVLCDKNDEDAARAMALTLNGPEKQQAYQGSKFAIGKWMRRVSGKWAARGLRINAIAPGATMTPLMERGLADPDFATGMRSFPIPTMFGTEGGYLQPEDIAEVMLFLLDKASRSINGAVIFADGGTDGLLRTEKF